jgi:hypothetical protein
MRLLRIVHPLLSLHLATAIAIPFRGFLADTNHLSKRNNVTGLPIKNGGNVIYGASVNLGGNDFLVVLDTGRHVYRLYFPLCFLTHATLARTSGFPVAFPTRKTPESTSPWHMLSVMPKVRILLHRNCPTEGALGNVNLAPLSFDNYTVDKQAYSN